MRLRLALLAVVTTLATVAPPLGTAQVLAVPRTQATTLEGLPVAAEPDRFVAAGATAAATSAPVRAPQPFALVGFEVPAAATAVEVRTSEDGRAWGPWYPAELLSDADGPDAGTAEAAAEDGRRRSEPVWTGAAAHLQVRVAGASPRDVDVTLIDTLGLSGGPVDRTVVPAGAVAEAADGAPRIVSRAGWGADESLRRSSPSYAPTVHLAVVHHTAGSNDYTPEEAAAVVRGIYHWHVEGNGWSDIGYNVLIDRFGTLYEGRAGGLERAVIGAHARGYNTGSFGVSVMGNFVDATPPEAAIDALASVLGWKAALHGFDPLGTTTAIDGVRRPTIVGHRDVGTTSCPGRIQGRLGELRTRAAAVAAELGTPFRDVAITSAHRDAIVELFDAGIVTGCAPNLYCPSEGVTRAHAASLLARTLGLAGDPEVRFPDVAETSPHLEAINALADAGVILGYPDGTFRPHRRIDRGQLATFLARALELAPVTAAGEATPFEDVPPDHPHAWSIAAVSAAGLTSGCAEGRYCPTGTTARDQMASFLSRARQTLAEATTTG